MKEPKQVIVIRKDLKMRKGKLAAQASHAAMMPIAPRGGFWGLVARAARLIGLHIAPINRNTRAWMNGPWVKVVVGCDSEEQLTELVEKAKENGLPCYVCVDAGRTEFKGQPTMTCASFGPAQPEMFEGITDGLQLL